jgi:hypothetical protein
MSDDDLVKRLDDINRNYDLARGVHSTIRDAKARIEALTAERDYTEGTNDTLIALNQSLTADNARLKSVVARFGLMFAGSVSVKQEDGRIVAVIVPPKGAVSHAALNTGKEPNHD